MAKPHELSRKELKGPDKFQQAAAEAAGWLSAHQKQIAAGVIATLGVVAAVVGISSWLEHRSEKAAVELSKVIDDIQGEISSVQVPGSGQPFFKSDEERQRAIVAAAADVRSRFPSSQAAATAVLVSGEAHVRLGEWEKALADFQAFLSSGKNGDSLRFAAFDGIARAYQGKGDLAQAVQAWERAGAEAPFYKDRAEIERARILAQMGRVDEARKALTGFDDGFKDSLLKPEAHEALSRMGGM